MSNLSTVSTEDLKEKRQSLQSERAGLLVEYRSIGAELNSRAALDKAQETIKGLNDADKSRLLQTLQASGVKSAEAVGDIGAS